MVYKIKVPSTN